MGERQITVDCDVIQADGGTRCASITGGWVALRLAVNKMLKAGDVILSDPITDRIAAVSCGIYAGQPVLDLDYPEDSEAGVDGNFVMTGSGRLVEVQMSAEGATFTQDEMQALLGLAEPGRGRTGRRAGRRRRMSRRFEGGRLVIASHNAGKVREIGALLAPFGRGRGLGGGAGSAGARGNRGYLRRKRPDQGPCGRVRVGPACAVGR